MYFAFRKSPMRRQFCIQLIKIVLPFTVLYVVTFGLVFPRILSKLGFSKYFNAEGMDKVVSELETHRNLIAFQYFGSLPQKQVQFKPGRNFPSISIVIPTTRRQHNKVHYIIQVVARILEEYFADQPNIVNIIVMNNDKIIQEHTDAIYLSKFVTVVNNTKEIHGNNYFYKQCKDMMNALNIGVQSSSDYIVVLEDDALPIHGIFKRLEYLITYQLSDYNTTTLALVKLYFPDKWYGYEHNDATQLILLSCTCATLAMFFCHLITNKCSMKLKSVHSSKTQLVLSYILFSIYFGLGAYFVGRVHLIEILKHYFPLWQTLLRAPRCCIPAVLYTHHFAQTLAYDMTCRNNLAVDLGIDDVVKKFNLNQFLVFPNMVTHIGYYSSLSLKENKVSEYSFMYDI